MDDNKLQSLVVCADALTKKLREIHDDPRYMAVWTFWATHGMNYNGPFYSDELASLEKVLQSIANDTNSRTGPS